MSATAARSTWLAIDTATDVAAVAVCQDDRVVSERVWQSRRRHTQELATAVADALSEAGLAVADLEGVAVAIGPGSYTGLRIGLSLAKGLAIGVEHASSAGRSLPVVGVPTLDILAAGLTPPSEARDAALWAVLEAGRGRVIAARYPAAQGPPGWPDPRALVVWTVAELAAHVRAGEWAAGELSPDAREALAAAGARVLPAAAGLRRPGWLAHLGRERWRAGEWPDLAALTPIYSGGETAASAPARPAARGAVVAGALPPPAVDAVADVVRPMTADDIDAVTALHERSFAWLLGEGHFARELANPIAAYVVAATPQRDVIGFAGLWFQADEAHVMTIAVGPRHQNRGVGARLMARIIAIAVERGAAVLTLEVRAGNAAAQALYRRFGFTEVGRRPRYYADTGEDGLIMTTPALDDPAWRAKVRALTARLG